MKPALTLLCLLLTISLMAQFDGYYDSDNWTAMNSPACNNGYVDLANVPASVHLVSSDDAPACFSADYYTEWQIAIPLTGTITFDWTYTANDRDGSSFDPFGYSVNGTITQLSANGQPKGTSQSGSTSVPVNEGDIFSFIIWATDNILGTGEAVISNFDGPECTLEVNIADPATLYYGYDPASCGELIATATGAQGDVSYSWSNGGDAASTTVCAESGDCIIMTVTATDAAGCEATASVLVEVVDVICHDKKGIQKVEVCHSPNGNNPQSICIAPSAVAAHLAHGDVLGECGEDPGCAEGDRKLVLALNTVTIEKPKMAIQLRNESVQSNADEMVTIVPHPASDMATLQIFRAPEGAYTISLYNMLGQNLMQQKGIYVRGESINLPVVNLQTGQYNLVMRWDEGFTITKELNVQKH